MHIVIPQSVGGQTRLCNLRVMRTSENARKSSETLVDVSGEPARSATVVASLMRGLWCLGGGQAGAGIRYRGNPPSPAPKRLNKRYHDRHGGG